MGKVCIGEQIRNVVSGRLDINIILKWLESTWNDRPGAWLYVVGEGGLHDQGIRRVQKKGGIGNLERVSLAK